MKSCLNLFLCVGVWGLFLLLPQRSTAQSITTPVLNTTAICYGGDFQLGFTLSGFTLTPAYPTVTVSVFLSDANGSFATPYELTAYPKTNGTFYDHISLTNRRHVLPAGNGYRLKLCVGTVCSTLSEPFTLAPENGMPITGDSKFRISLQPFVSTSQYICPAKPARFEVKNELQADLQWFKDNLPMSG
ncbi:hypothetical protein GCM10028807_50450 [Spirosoma daeguense]